MRRAKAAQRAAAAADDEVAEVVELAVEAAGTEAAKAAEAAEAADAAEAAEAAEWRSQLAATREKSKEEQASLRVVRAVEAGGEAAIQCLLGASDEGGGGGDATAECRDLGALLVGFLERCGERRRGAHDDPAARLEPRLLPRVGTGPRRGRSAWPTRWRPRWTWARRRVGAREEGGEGHGGERAS